LEIAKGDDLEMCLAIPGEILEVREERGLKFGKVRFGGITRDVCLAYVPDAVPGEFVAVHVGFAITKIDAEEAARSYRILEEIGQTAELTADLDEQADLPPRGSERT
jgi:hydrogenase expression/formation protein HypC